MSAAIKKALVVLSGIVMFLSYIWISSKFIDVNNQTAVTIYAAISILIFLSWPVAIGKLFGIHFRGFWTKGMHDDDFSSMQAMAIVMYTILAIFLVGYIVIRYILPTT